MPGGARHFARSISRCRCSSPAKASKFATLPDGQDPDDLARSGGREAIDGRAFRLASAGACLVVARERSRAVRYAGAARRARGAHRRSHGTIAEETVRRYYRQDFSARLRQDVRARGDLDAPRGFDAKGRRNFATRARPRTSTTRRRRGGARCARSPAFGSDGALRGGEPASCDELAASRPSRRDSAPRSADPAGGGQSSLAAARSPRGTGRGRVPSCRHRKSSKAR